MRQALDGKGRALWEHRAGVQPRLHQPLSCVVRIEPRPDHNAIGVGTRRARESRVVQMSDVEPFPESLQAVPELRLHLHQRERRQLAAGFAPRRSAQTVGGNDSDLIVVEAIANLSRQVISDRDERDLIRGSNACGGELLRVCIHPAQASAVERDEDRELSFGH